MDLPGQLIFSNASWLPYVLGSLVFFVLLLLWSYRGSGLSWPRTLMFVSLKVAAALASITGPPRASVDGAKTGAWG